MKHVVVDLEMNGLAGQYKEERRICGMETIEIGAVVLDEHYVEIGAFKTLVKPQYNTVIEKRYRKLTGITTEMVAEAPGFEKALNMFLTWCHCIDDEIQFYQWSTTDLTQILREIELKEIKLSEENYKMLADWNDFQKEYGDKLMLSDAISLKKATMYAGVEVKGRAHDALNDARNTGELLRVLRNPKLFKRTLQHVMDALIPSSMGTTLGDLFDFNELCA